MGEDSTSVLKREMREELDSEIEIRRLIWIVENFLTLDEKRKRTTTDGGIEIHFA